MKMFKNKDYLGSIETKVMQVCTKRDKIRVEKHYEDNWEVLHLERIP